MLQNYIWIRWDDVSKNAVNIHGIKMIKNIKLCRGFYIVALHQRAIRGEIKVCWLETCVEQ